MGLPDIQHYYWAANIRCLAFWNHFYLQPNSPEWTSLEMCAIHWKCRPSSGGLLATETSLFWVLLLPTVFSSHLDMTQLFRTGTGKASNVKCPPLARIKTAWEHNLGHTLSPDQWDSILTSIHKSSLCSRHRLVQYHPHLQQMMPPLSTCTGCALTYKNSGETSKRAPQAFASLLLKWKDAAPPTLTQLLQDIMSVALRRNSIKPGA